MTIKWCAAKVTRGVWCAVHFFLPFKTLRTTANPFLWAGPVLGSGDSLIFTGSNGKHLLVRQSGEITKVMDVGTPLYLSPLLLKKPRPFGRTG